MPVRKKVTMQGVVVAELLFSGLILPVQREDQRMATGLTVQTCRFF